MDNKRDNKGEKEFKSEKFQTGNDLEKWYGQEVAAKSDPLVDAGTGKPILIRIFDFKKNPEVKKYPSKQDVFNAHARQIRDFLWKDGLKIREDHDPKLMFTKDGYRIAIVCEARLGVMWMDRPRTLQQILPSKKK